ncbi:MAG: PrsW family intramembrane metalloprotease [Saprospiraceae bacterium]|nr:PrsW family intramembrane metalloprotease [Saprospiraceae bacterium]
MNIVLLVLAIAPGLLISYWVYKLDLYDKEPRIHVVLSFAVGVLAAYAATKIETWGATHWRLPHHIGGVIVTSFVLVALVEESIKWCCLLVYPYRQPFFNEPLDGILYAVMIAMGFATFENVIFAWKHDLTTMLLRAFTAVPAHALFAVVMGYYAGSARFSGKKTTILLLRGWLIAVGLHGAYDFFLMQKAYQELTLLALVTLGLCFYLAKRLIRLHQENSPFRH